MHALAAATFIALAIVSSANAAEAPVAAPKPHPPYGAPLSLQQAKFALVAAEAEAKKNGWAMVIAIVEPSGALVLLEKMDGAQYGSLDVAERKAKTAAQFRRPTSEFQEAVKSGNLNSVFTGALAIEGGELLLSNGRIVGAIGVSGGNAQQDGQVARAAAALLK
jgi:uncharacterized protein GlcG (DUF336 family)